MPKKSTRHVREPGLARSSQHRSNPGTGPEVKAKHLRSVHIGVTNGKRWLSLKKRLGLSTDEDVAVYLLDLAESLARQEEECNGSSQEEKSIRDDKAKEETIQAEIPPDEPEEEPLRRSLRKQTSGASSDPEVSSVDTVQTECLSKVSGNDLCAQRSSRSKHHKNKARHRKDKRKKRRHLRATCDASNRDIVTLDSEVTGRKISDEETAVDIQDTRLGNEVDTESNLDIGSFESEKDVKSRTTKTDHIDNIELLDNVNTKKNGSKHSDENSDLPNTEKIEQNESALTQLNSSCTSTNIRNNIDDGEIERSCDKTDTISVAYDEDKGSPESEREHNLRHKNSLDYDNAVCNVLKDVDPSKDVEDRKSKKKRKRPRYDLEEEEENTLRDFSEDFIDDNVHKHRKRKHRHTGEHKSRKRHDVRKAPQDGLVTSEELENTTSIANDAPEPAIDKSQADVNPDNFISEPQRLAIKIKLCQDCNSRHLQDACPLTTPLYSIPDSITYEDWIVRHRENVEVVKAIKSDDPMDEGYGKPVDENCESDDDGGSVDRNKAKSKAPREEKQLITNADRPLYARESLPDCFELKMANSEHGLGIYAKSTVPMYVKLGPLIGKPVREMDIPDDFPMRHIWEIDNNGKTSYISTTNPLKSNWVRYIRPAETKEERSVAVITRDGELHLVTTQNIVSGMELTYWADSQSSAWTRKNKVDKTNCGGCNLNFAHPIYYRLHCCIFHDTNYSLTIRKYHCKVCGAAVLGKDNIMKHAAELHAGRGAYQCQYCKKFFLRLNYLEMHRTYGCAQNPQRSRPLCDFCGRKFCQPQKLKVHIKRMHSDMSEVLREFQCKLCLKLLGSRAALQRHMKEVHHKDVVGAATCDRCGKMFQNKSNLKIHMLTHSGVKPFKCKENGCKAAFTTKQCLQFHYKKVHGLTEEMMPKIERSVAYTFDAYSGGLVEDAGRGKTPRPVRRNSQQDSNSIPSMDDISCESLKIEPSGNAVHAGVMEFPSEPPNLSPKYKLESESRIGTPSVQTVSAVPVSMSGGLEAPVIETTIQRAEVDLYSSTRVQSKGSKKWLGEFNPPTSADIGVSHIQQSSVHANVYDFEDNRKEDDGKVSPNPTRTQAIMDSTKLGLSVYRRTESANASLLVEAALDAAERDIGAVSSPILEDNERDANLYSISSQLQSPLPHRSPNHLDSYMQQQDELISPVPTPDNRHTPPSHLHVDYHIHRPCIDYITTPRTHNIDQYLHHEDMQRVSSPNNYIHIQQEDLVSPAGTPNPRYQDVHHHHQVSADNLSSDEGDSVAQNLSLSVKEKALQLDLSAPYKYETLEQEFTRERSNFEPLVLNSTELQGLDMSARGFHHSGFGAQVQNPRYHHHHHHLYDIAERQSVDLSRTGSYPMSSSPPTSGSSSVPCPQGPGVSSGSSSAGTPNVSVSTAPPPPPYPHSDVLRVVSLDLTPGGRHSVDLSLSRTTHHLHSSTSARVITSPQPAVSATPHAVPDTLEGRILSPPPPPPPLTGYNPNYPVSPAPYHPPRSGYHHYTGYY